MKNLISNILHVTGYRFSKAHRVNNSVLTRIINTTECNQRAEYKKLGINWA